MTRHQRLTHPQPVEGCGPCRWSSVQVSAGATPTRTEAKPGQRAFMENFAAEFSNGDREAYLALRRQGYQPPKIAGSAELAARASTRYEIETGVIAENPDKLKEALAIADQGGFDPLVPATAPREGKA